MDISIVQFMTPNIDGFGQYSAASGYKYALRNGYKYYIQRTQSLDGIHVMYSKNDALKKALELPADGSEESYVMVFDADMVIIELDRKIEWFINNYGDQNSLIYMPQDVGRESHKLKRPNAGFIIVKKSEEGLAIIKKWIGHSMSDENPYKFAHPFDQGVYWKHILPDIGEKLVVLPLRFFEFSPIQRLGLFRFRKPFLDHILRRTPEKRTQMMKDLYVKYIKDQELLQEMQQLLLSHDNGFFQVLGDPKKLHSKDVS